MGPYDEMYVSEDGGAWGSLKAFPRALPIPLASKEDLALLSGLDGLGTADQRSIKLNADEIEQVLSVTRLSPLQTSVPNSSFPRVLRTSPIHPSLSMSIAQTNNFLSSPCTSSACIASWISLAVVF